MTTEFNAPAIEAEAGKHGIPWPGQVAALAVILVVAPMVFYPIFLIKVLCIAVFASAFNLLVGYAGLMSFGHAAFFGVGAYIAAWTARSWNLTPELAVLAGGTTAMVMGIVFGWIAIRRQGIFFAMITLALGQMVYFFFVQAPFAGGEDGIQHVPRGRLFGLIPLDSDLSMYGFAAVVYLAAFVAIHRVIHSPFGHVLTGIRENESRAVSLGYEASHYKLGAFVISSLLSGIAGGTKAIAFGIATLTDVHAATSGQIVLTALVGGMGTVFGPSVGAVVMTAMEQYLAGLGSWVTVIQGLVFILCVLLFRNGIVGTLMLMRRRTPVAPVAPPMTSAR
jgi:branched-chain amino acid transport system permease protein